MANIHEHAVLSDVLERKGSGFTARHGEDFMMANNAQFVGFSMEIGPEGGLYVLDWHDADICGKEVLNKETGRIFRIIPNRSLAENWDGRYADLNEFTNEQLVSLQKSKSDWHARRARIILQKRAAKQKPGAQIYAQLMRMFLEETNVDLRLRAMWSLHVTGGFSEDELGKALNDKDEYIRAWAIQLLCEDKKPSQQALSRFSSMAREERSAVVRLYLASALQRINKNAIWPIASALMKHAADSSDHNIPKMIWTGIEPVIKEDPAMALKYASTSGIPVIAQWTARRLVDADQMQLLVSWLDKQPATLFSLMQGMRDGMEGRYDLTAPSNWKVVYTKLSRADRNISLLATSITEQFGNTEAAMKFLSTLRSNKASTAARRSALQVISNRQRPELVKEFPMLLKDPELKIDAIRAIAAYDHEPLGKMLIEQYAGFTSAEKLQAIQTLSSRPKYGWLLAQALAKNVIPKSDVPAYAARQLLRVVGSGFIEIWGPVEQTNFDEKAYLRYKKLLTDQAISKANPVRGRAVFKTTCGPCHKMYGEGGIIGPDLTGSNRTNVEYLLSNVMDPSGEIQDDYKMVVVTTRDGRNYAGNIASENERQLVMRVVGQDAVVINKSNIQSRETTAASMMPPGLFNSLNDQDVLALVAYLRTMDPGAKAKAN
jgi:putative heme-binding domain-containing protein